MNRNQLTNNLIVELAAGDTSLATTLARSEDAAHASGDPGIQFLTIRRTTPVTSAQAVGRYAAANSDDNGNLWVTSGTLTSGENQTSNRIMVEVFCTAAYISTATTTVVKTGAGFLHSITVEGGTTGTIIIYDNTAASGTIIASFDSTVALATYILDVAFSVGCTIITSAATKITVSFR